MYVLNKMKTFYFLILLPLVVLFISCKETTTEPTEPAKIKLAKVSNLMAYSFNSTSVGLKWTKSKDEEVSDFDGYRIQVYTLDNNMVKRESVSKGDSIIITGLTNGVIYKFEVITKAQSNSRRYEDSEPEVIQWSPAWRFETEGTIPIQVYETASPTGFPSGLIFYHPTNKAPKTVSILSADSSLIDVYVATISGSTNIELRSSHRYRPTRKITRFSTVFYDVNSLNDPRPAPPDTATYTKYEWLIESTTVPSSKVLYFKTQEGNYGRILLMRNPTNGTLIWGTSPERYVRVQISYQSVPYNRFSKNN